MTDSISSSTSPTTTAYTTYNEEGVNVSDVSTPQQVTPDLSYYTGSVSDDPLLQSQEQLEQHAPSPPRQEASDEAGAPAKVSVRDLQSKRGDHRLHTSLRSISNALSDPTSFDQSTFEDSKSLGVQLNASFFDRGSQTPYFYKGLSDMLDNPVQTRATLHKALAHLPEDVRGDAVSQVMDKMTNKLCGKIQEIMKRDVNAAAQHAKATLAPYSGDDSTARAKLMHNMIETSPAMSKADMITGLQEAGIAKGDAISIASSLLKAKADPAQRDAIRQAATGGNFKGEQWSKGTFVDGDVKNLDEAMQAAFADTQKHIDSVVGQMANDASRANATFTNPLFERAKDNACKQLGISLKDGSGSSKAINGKIDDQKFMEKRDAVVAKTIMFTAGLAVPGGLVAGLVTGAVSSAPGVMIAQHNYDASRSGVAMGTNSQKLATANGQARNKAVFDAATEMTVGAVVGGKDLVGDSAVGGVARALDTKHGAAAAKDVAKAVGVPIGSQLYGALSTK